jgi:D-alanine--poly(phosphoribitol) ligase subunit 2
MTTRERVLATLEEVTGTDQVRHDLDLRLFDLALLTSLGLVMLVVNLSEQLGIEIAPAEIEREQWATPRHIIAVMESRVGP